MSAPFIAQADKVLTVSDLADLPAGTEVGGRFRIRREIGRGGMGVVYEAVQIALDREVALKTLHPELLRDPVALERFQREARAAAAIEHNGIVRVFDLATVGGIAFIVMERLRGEDLRMRIKREGALPWRVVVEIGRELADAIAAAHERGILHRDLSPANVFLARDDAGREGVKVLDFGIARLLSAAGLRSQPAVGTLMYMAPERVAGAVAADPRSDVYAMGAVLYEALSGAPPFPLCEYPELALKIALQEPLSLRARTPECPEAVVAVVQRAMQREPAHRFQSARELCTALEAIARAQQRQAAVPTVLQTAPSVPPRAAQPSRMRWLRSGSAFAVCAAAGVFAFALTGARPAKRVLPAPTVLRTQSGSALGVAATASLGATPTAIAPAPPLPGSTTAGSVDAPVAARPVHFVTHPPHAKVSIAEVGSCRAPCTLALPNQAGLVVRARAGELRAWQRLPSPPPPQVELWLEPARSDSSQPPATAPSLPPLMPRR